MTENMQSLFGRLPLSFLLMLLVLGKTFDSINFLCFFLMMNYTYYVLVKGECPNCHIVPTIKLGVMMIIFVMIIRFIPG